MGADKGIHVVTEARTDQEVQPLAVAKILAQLAQREKVDAVIVGKQAIDGDNAQTGPMVSGLLNWSQVSMASNVSVKPGEVCARDHPFSYSYFLHRTHLLMCSSRASLPPVRLTLALKC
jgi:electron transfer flavoprotein alpha/beta subunit